MSVGDYAGTAGASDVTVAAAGQASVSPSPGGAIPPPDTGQTARASWIQAAASTKPQDFQVYQLYLQCS